MTKKFQGMEKFFQGMEIILKILPCAVSVRVLTSEGRIGSARRGCGPYHLRRQRLQGLRADGRDVEEEANVKSLSRKRKNAASRGFLNLLTQSKEA